ncbi:von Willebrand factor, type A [Candidatus Vecturithrix granuli]|uniref:von Willebrand factor, type A n=1 Tax=Vecturithrix granuli TaxID=1499967 RepID=A0A081C314_VECG1|nr:von Willebrand factor, type A [Candidatus Vecturithrix granuli]
MSREYLKSAVTFGFFLIVISVTMAKLHGGYLADDNSPAPQPSVVSHGDGPLGISAHLVQDKIFFGGDGTVSLALTMSADVAAVSEDDGVSQHVDMVVVLDQSGSMSGQKIEYARQAILDLLSGLSSQDRFALIGYADRVWCYADLNYATDTNRLRLQNLIRQLAPGGNTNLGGGLQEGINTLLTADRIGNVEKVILISDGLANRGIVDPESLGNMASLAIEKEFAISTVGVGEDFNEQLMTAIADRGAGNYYYLANPQSFAAIFQQEFQHAKTVAARAMEISIPLPDGVSLLYASGYPVSVSGNRAVVHPGDLLAGQTRKLFLTLQFPTSSEITYRLQGLAIRYLHQGNPYTATFPTPFQIACVNNPDEVVASIVHEEWEQKVLQEDFNALREKVALELKKGKKQEALQQIDSYYQQQNLLNAEIGSAKVSVHLDEELNELRDIVEQTFTGSVQQVEMQQKSNAKSLQYEGYKERRAQK